MLEAWPADPAASLRVALAAPGKKESTGTPGTTGPTFSPPYPPISASRNVSKMATSNLQEKMRLGDGAVTPLGFQTHTNAQANKMKPLRVSRTLSAQTRPLQFFPN